MHKKSAKDETQLYHQENDQGEMLNTKNILVLPSDRQDTSTKQNASHENANKKQKIIDEYGEVQFRPTESYVPNE